MEDLKLSIGNILQAARKKRGISIKEASERTKIRKNFLEAFESDQFSINLPEIYTLGLIRVYAKYLHLDTGQIADEFRAIYHPERKQRKESNEHLDYAKIPLDYASSKNIYVENEETTSEGPKPSFFKKNTKLTKKIVITGIILCFFLFLILVLGKKKKAQTATKTHQAEIVAPISSQQIFLIGLGDTQVMVRDQQSKQRLFSGLLHKGERRIIDQTNSLQIHFTEGSNIVIEKSNGEQIRPQKTGIGWVKVD